MKVIFSSVLFVLIVLQLDAQNIALSKADRLYQLYAYSEAVESYEKILKRNKDDEYLIQQIAYCYEKMELYQEALFYFEKHIKSKRARYEDFYRYATLLLIDSQFDKAIEEFESCIKRNPNDKRPAEQIERIREFDRLNLLHMVDTVINIDLNTRFADMSPAFYKDSIAFISARDSSGRNTYSWNNEPFLDIYQFGEDKNGEIEIQKIPGVNTKYHEGPLVFTENDQKIWFTRNNQSFSGIDGEETNNLRIYRAEWNGKKWHNVEDFQYNSNAYSVGHPAFSPDGNTMYFASNMEGAVGQTDLFKVKRIEIEDKKGRMVSSWSEPENMGSQFNTVGKEMFPYVDSRGVIYFSSDGLIGFGGLDAYAAFPVADSFNVINIGQPINSTYDDFSFIVADDFLSGYITSNRPGGKGSDDIYNFNIGMQHLFIYVLSLQESKPVVNADVVYTVDNREYMLGKTDTNGFISLNVDFKKDYYFEASHPNYISNNDSLQAFEIFKLFNHKKTIYIDNASILQVLVLNEENKDPLAGVDVILTLSNGDTLNFVSDASGKVKYRLAQTGVIDIDFHKDGFVSQETSIDIESIGEGNYSKTVSLEPIYEGKTFRLENLYYDVNSSLIRDDAALVLDQLYKILIEFPDMKIELSSHTDCRADNSYNQWLSQKRAQSAVNYLVTKGIDLNRMIAVGYGESKLLNHCADGIKCSEEEHQVNRRTEFKVLEF